MLRAHFLAASLLAFAACAPGDQTQENCHWIGTLNPLTGDLGTVGLPLENAAKLAVQDVNRASLVGGKSLCIAPGDDRTNPDRAVAVADALARAEGNPILALNGAAASSSTLKAAEAADRFDMAIVSCCSTSPLLSQNPKIFRTVPSDALQGVALATIAFERQVSKLVVIYLNDSYGVQLRDQFHRKYVELTGRENSIDKEVPYEAGQENYGEVVRSALGTSPELVVLIAFPIAGAEIIKAWSEARIAPNVQWLGTDGLKDNKFVFLTGDIIPHFEGTAPRPESIYYSSFVDRYRATFGGELPGIFTSNQYDAVILIALALARATAERPGAPPEELRPLIRSYIPELSRPPGDPVNANDLNRALSLAASGADLDYRGVSGPVDLDELGDVLSGYQVWSIPLGGGTIVEENVCFDCMETGTSTAGIECTKRGCDGSPG